MTIDKGIPIPARGKWETIIASMKIGDSILVDDPVQRNYVLTIAKRIRKPVLSRKVDGGWRLWRIKK